MKDAGNFGFFSQRQVINLDGLVNNLDYQDVLRDRKLNDYFKRMGVQYLVQHALWDRNDVNTGDYEVTSIRYYSHKYLVTSDEILLKKTDEVYRSSPYFEGSRKVVFLIWKLQFAE